MGMIGEEELENWLEVRLSRLLDQSVSLEFGRLRRDEDEGSGIY